MRSWWGITDDDTALSPVIGVVLMIALTIALAGIVHAVAFGIADESLEAHPNAAFTTDSGPDECKTAGLVITHAAGETIPADELYVTADGTTSNPSGSWADPTDYATTGTSGGAVSAGDEALVRLDGEDATVGIVWQSSSSDRSVVLAERSP